MDGGEHDDLSVRELGLEIFENRIHATFESFHILIEIPPRQRHHLAVAVDFGILHFIPLPERNIVVEIVGALEDEYGVKITPERFRELKTIDSLMAEVEQ